MVFAPLCQLIGGVVFLFLFSAVSHEQVLTLAGGGHVWQYSLQFADILKIGSVIKGSQYSSIIIIIIIVKIINKEELKG